MKDSATLLLFDLLTVLLRTPNLLTVILAGLEFCFECLHLPFLGADGALIEEGFGWSVSHFY